MSGKWQYVNLLLCPELLDHRTGIIGHDDGMAGHDTGTVPYGAGMALSTPVEI
jgi:hypothetical protein